MKTVDTKQQGQSVINKAQGRKKMPLLFPVDCLVRPWGMEEEARRSLSKLAKFAETELGVWKTQAAAAHSGACQKWEETHTQNSMCRLLLENQFTHGRKVSDKWGLLEGIERKSDNAHTASGSESEDPELMGV